MGVYINANLAVIHRLIEPEQEFKHYTTSMNFITNSISPGSQYSIRIRSALADLTQEIRMIMRLIIIHLNRTEIKAGLLSFTCL